MLFLAPLVGFLCEGDELRSAPQCGQVRAPAVRGALSLARTRRDRGDFPGAAVIAQQIEDKTCQKRVGLKLSGAPAREGAEIADKDGNIIGTVTSGGFGPTVSGPVAMGYIDRGFLEPGTEVDVLVRGKARPATITKLPFVPANFYRG